MDGFEAIIGVNPWTALFTLLNMIITFLILGKFLFKPVKKMIDDRQKEIDDAYAEADKAKSDAQELKAEYQRHLDSAKSERDDIIKEAVVTAGKRSDEIVAEARRDADAIRDKAERDIAQEKKKAMNEVKSSIAGISLDIAEKVCEKEIDEGKHRALIEEFVNKMGEAS